MQTQSSGEQMPKSTLLLKTSGRVLARTSLPGRKILSPPSPSRPFTFNFEHEHVTVKAISKGPRWRQTNVDFNIAFEVLQLMAVKVNRCQLAFETWETKRGSSSLCICTVRHHAHVPCGSSFQSLAALVNYTSTLLYNNTKNYKK